MHREKVDAFTNPALKSGRGDVISPLSGNLRKALQVKREGKIYWARQGHMIGVLTNLMLWLRYMVVHIGQVPHLGISLHST